LQRSPPPFALIDAAALLMGFACAGACLVRLALSGPLNQCHALWRLFRREDSMSYQLCMGYEGINYYPTASANSIQRQLTLFQTVNKHAPHAKPNAMLLLGVWGMPANGNEYTR
jgi:hypothetical protein